MQALTKLLLTMTTLLLLSNAVKPLPVLTVGDDEMSVQGLRNLPVEQHAQRKRICGMTWVGCDIVNGVKTNLLVIILFVFVVIVCLFVLQLLSQAAQALYQITLDLTLAHKRCCVIVL